MGIRNFLIEGGSCSGKTTVATALERLGHHVVHGDRVLAYQGDPSTGIRLAPEVVARHKQDAAFRSRHHIWDVEAVRAMAADGTHPATFFCGGSRNHESFLSLFDAVFLLEIDLATLEARLDTRRDEWGSQPDERALILTQYRSREDLPKRGISIDATRSPLQVVEAILSLCR